jgi:hypothetical protein
MGVSKVKHEGLFTCLFTKVGVTSPKSVWNQCHPRLKLINARCPDQNQKFYTEDDDDGVHLAFFVSFRWLCARERGKQVYAFNRLHTRHSVSV